MAKVFEKLNNIPVRVQLGELKISYEGWRVVNCSLVSLLFVSLYLGITSSVKSFLLSKTPLFFIQELSL
jgi:hypothetical protein